MKTENYNKKDGSAGTRYTLEKGDIVKALYAMPRETVPGKSKYPIYSIKAAWKGKEVYVTLTTGQYKRLMGIGSLEGKEIIALGYEGPDGEELVGLTVLK